MSKEEYQDMVNRICPKENRLGNGILAFFVGGFMGVLGNFLVNLYAFLFDIPTKEASTFMIITLVFLGCILTAIGIFDKLVSKCKCGLIIPITGFAHSMMSATMEYKREGFVTGIGMNMFKLAGSVIMFGVVSAYFLGIIRYFIGG